MNHHRIVKGDVVKVVSSLFVDDYFDACLCDPPYLLQFMGKEFDKQHTKMRGANEGQKMQAWHEQWAREVLRVMKPGAYVLAFGGTRTYHRLASAMEDVGFVVEDTLQWLHGQGFPKGKTKLKPAQEPIVLARRPGANRCLAVDECRVAGAPRNPGNKGDQKPGDFRDAGGYRGNDPSTYKERVIDKGLGRWPANLILSHHEACNEKCHPDCPVKMLDEQSGITKSTASGYNFDRSPQNRILGKGLNLKSGVHFGDKGGASRFFYCAKVSPRERNLGEINCQHPTLKPISLTTYLSRLLLPPARPKPPRRLLIPFSGAGSEIIGALLAGWDEVWGIEQDSEYIADAEARIAARHELTKLKGQT